MKNTEKIKIILREEFLKEEQDYYKIINITSNDFVVSQGLSYEKAEQELMDLTEMAPDNVFEIEPDFNYMERMKSEADREELMWKRSNYSRNQMDGWEDQFDY